jgi:protoporphyrinogen/coproporphyrinogen III oxidase
MAFAPVPVPAPGGTLPVARSAFVGSVRCRAVAPSSGRVASRRAARLPSPSPLRAPCGMTLADRPVSASATPTPAPASRGKDAAVPAAPTDVDVLVVGSGVSGCALAHSLQKAHPELSLLMTEARDVVGGNIISREEGGYIWEEGPNTFQPAPHIMRLAVDIGLKDDIVLADHTLPRLVYWDGGLFALPLGPKDIPEFKLLSLPGAIRAGLGALGFVLPNRSGKEESIKDFITRHLGAEVFAKMIDPFVSGVYAGNPAKLSMSSAFKKIYALQELGITRGIIEGAIIRINQRKREAPPPDPDLPTWQGGALGSFRKGLGMLPKAVADRLGPGRVRLNWKLLSIERAGDGCYRATYKTPQGKQVVHAKAVALTVPAHAAATILADIAPEAGILHDIHYPCVYSVTLAYPKSEFKTPLRGFGNLIPRSMGVRTLGTIWSSCLFPGRAPPGMELLLSYIGGAQDPSIVDLTEDQVVAAVDGDVKKILLKSGSTVNPTVVGVRKWPRAIPQYNIGHSAILEKVEKSLANSPGIFLGGNYASGVAFGDCVLWGTENASKIAEFVESKAKV